LKPLLGPIVRGGGRSVWCHRCVVAPDWWIETEIDAGRQWRTELFAYHAIVRSDSRTSDRTDLYRLYGAVGQPRHATTSLSSLYGVGGYYCWAVRCQSDLDRAIAAMRELWTYLHSQIAPLLADLTIDG
jgi:hypothetical protein